jgi:hypothetical protein
MNVFAARYLLPDNQQAEISVMAAFIKVHQISSDSAW